MSYLMQARSSETGELVTWVTAEPDWAAASFPGPGTAEHIAAALGVATPETPFTPGSDGQLIFNDAGTLGATAKLRYDKVNGRIVYEDDFHRIWSCPGKTQTDSLDTVVVASFPIADESECQFDWSVLCVRRTNVTKSGSFKGSVTYRRTGGAAPVLVGEPTLPLGQQLSGGTVTYGFSANTFELRFAAADIDPRNVGAELRVEELLAT